jgi:hypothetical protein
VSEQWEGTVTDPIEREVAERSRVIKSEPTTVSDMINEFWAEEDTRDREPTGAETLWTEYDRLCFRERDLMRDGQAKHVTELDEMQARRFAIRRILTPAEVAAIDGVTVSRDILRTTILAWAEREFGARGIAATATLFAALRASNPATTARDEREGE